MISRTAPGPKPSRSASSPAAPTNSPAVEAVRDLGFSQAGIGGR